MSDALVSEPWPSAAPSRLPSPSSQTRTPAHFLHMSAKPATCSLIPFADGVLQVQVEGFRIRCNGDRFINTQVCSVVMVASSILLSAPSLLQQSSSLYPWEPRDTVVTDILCSPVSAIPPNAQCSKNNDACVGPQRAGGRRQMIVDRGQMPEG